MKTSSNKTRRLRVGMSTRRSGFTLVEAMVASGILGLVVVALFAGITMCFSTVQLSRENVRATQILQDKMESIRLYNWDQINESGFIPADFVEPHYPGGSTNSGVFYSGTMAVEPAPITQSYSNDMRSVTVAVSWTSDGVLRTRDMQTFVSRYGLQNYIY